MGVRASFWSVTPARLRELGEEPARLDDFLAEDPEGMPDVEATDIDKAWHGLHWLLTGSDWSGTPPLDFLVQGGEPLGDEDAGTRAFSTAQVQRLSAALAPITREALRGRFDPKAMLKADIYPPIWDRPPEEDDTLGYLLEYFDELKAFVARAAAAGRCLIIQVG